MYFSQRYFFGNFRSLLSMLLVWGTVTISVDNVAGHLASFAVDRVLLSEWKLVQLFSPRAGEIPENSDLSENIKGYLDSFFRGTNLKMEDVSDDCAREERCYRQFVDHPIYTFKMVKRYALQLPAIISHPDSPKCLNLSPFLVSTPDFPNSDDVETLAEGLLTLQQLYKFKTTEMAAGNFPNYKSIVKSKLDPSDAYDVARRALKMGYFPLASEWAEYGQLQQSLGLNGSSKNQPDFLQLKKEIRQAEDNGTHANFWQNYRADKPVRSPQDQRLLETFHYNLTTLCSGKSLQTKKERSGLFCWLEKNIDPYFLIHPLKIELHSKSPFIIQVHEAIGSKMMQRIEEVEQIYGKRPYADYTSKVNDREYMESRTPPHFSYEMEFRPLFDIVNTTFGHISKKTECTITSEHIPVGLHGWPWRLQQMFGLKHSGVNLGRHVAYHMAIHSHNFDAKTNQHIDRFTFENVTRIATALAYVSKVHMGGATVYPIFGVTVPPVKGSIVLHFNLYRDGFHVDPQTLHYGCPPVIGRKRTVSKLLIYQEQMEAFKCGVDRWDLFNWDFMKQKYNPAVRHL